MERITTGIAELDEKVSGGYPKSKTMLITGAPGTGKTIFGLHFLYKGCIDGRKCMLIATEEMPEDILTEAGILGLDLRPYVDSGQLIIDRVLEARTESTKMAAQFGTGFEITEMDILERVQSVPDDVEVVVIDNIGIFALDLSIKEFRNKIDTINYILSGKGCTTVFIMDETAYELTHMLAEYSVYGSIKLMIKDNPYTGMRERYLDIPKMRGTDISLELSVFDITSKGIIFRKPGTKIG
jgi:KaiC/GvpD/RAD55 family RecA-like ATPase